MGPLISNLVCSPTWWVGPSAGSPLGAMPLPAALAGLPLFSVASSNTAASVTASTSLAAAPTLASPLLPCPKPPAERAVVLSSALPPIGAKLAQKIKSQQYVAMKELLADNMALHSQLEDLPAQAAVGARPHRLREIDSPLSWVFCFLGYVAVRTKDSETRNMLSYARLIVREAQCHGGIGWLEYDKWFRQQQAALTTQHPWNELNASLHAATVMSLRSGDSKLCKLCREPDHADSQCALASLQPPQPYAWPTTAGAAAGRRVTRPDTLERICTSWNKGRCAFPGSCRFRHVCASCKRKGHRARECEETPAGSPYKTSAQPGKASPERSQQRAGRE